MDSKVRVVKGHKVGGRDREGGVKRAEGNMRGETMEKSLNSHGLEGV